MLAGLEDKAFNLLQKHFWRDMLRNALSRLQTVDPDNHDLYLKIYDLVPK